MTSLVPRKSKKVSKKENQVRAKDKVRAKVNKVAAAIILTELFAARLTMDLPVLNV